MYRLKTATMDAAPATTGRTSAFGCESTCPSVSPCGACEEPGQQLREDQDQDEPEEVHGSRVRDEAQRRDDVVHRLVAPDRLPHAERDREREPGQCGQHGEDQGLRETLFDEPGDRLVQRVRGAEVAVQQGAQVVEVLDGERAVEALLVVELRDLLGRRLRAEDPARGSPGSACSRQKTTTVTMRITARDCRTRRVR